MRISCLQSDVFFGQPEKNIAHYEHLLEKAVIKDKPSVVLLPELWTTGYDLKNLDSIADDEGQIARTVLSKWAKQYGVHIIGGSIAKATKKGVYNTTYVVHKDGIVIHEYSKLHLFQLMDEHLYLTPGEGNGLFSLEGEMCASFICYDLRFPEWIRTHTANGAKVIFFVAEWPLARTHHWRSLLIARAIENQCYVVSCNRTGSDPNNVFAGHSMIIDPWGDIIQEGSEQEEIVTGDIDIQKVDEVRKQIPIFSDRKPNFY
ncbi:carbon-nitrogen family hydrolase [Bacillus sp. FJAT-47783]|uniref:carbon-nitrogen family hydrolase n=1 Tax=Bacillus sp. FJAT-47783 TaxID=2922712 RepID=UPI001FAE7351|nr:carbon-nitrogen family hydrolase [Bacillus sp. FJAT-47783]